MTNRLVAGFGAGDGLYTPPINLNAQPKTTPAGEEIIWRVPQEEMTTLVICGDHELTIICQSGRSGTLMGILSVPTASHSEHDRVVAKWENHARYTGLQIKDQRTFVGPETADAQR